MDTAAGLDASYRLFIAIRLPHAIKDGMELAQQQLRAVMKGGSIRWTTRDQFHLTLRFLGNVEARRVQPLVEALRLASGGFAPLDLLAGSVGFFPERGHPRVVWIGVRDERGQLLALQRSIEAATQQFTGEVPERHFAGHVTLGRVKGINRLEAEALALATAAMANRVFGRWTVGETELIRSELSPDGRNTRASIKRISLEEAPSHVEDRVSGRSLSFS